MAKKFISYLSFVFGGVLGLIIVHTFLGLLLKLNHWAWNF